MAVVSFSNAYVLLQPKSVRSFPPLHSKLLRLLGYVVHSTRQMRRIPRAPPNEIRPTSTTIRVSAEERVRVLSPRQRRLVFLFNRKPAFALSIIISARHHVHVHAPRRCDWDFFSNDIIVVVNHVVVRLSQQQTLERSSRALRHLLVYTFFLRFSSLLLRERSRDGQKRFLRRRIHR